METHNRTNWNVLIHWIEWFVMGVLKLNIISMNSYFAFAEQQVKFLTDEYHIYLRKTGRISMCGLNNRNIAYVAKAIHAAVTTIPS